MKFWDKLKAKYSPEYDQEETKRVAFEGEKLELFVSSGNFDILIEHILDPMEKEAFAAFTKIDPSSTLEIMQTQKIAQVVSVIKQKVESKIQAGLLARQQLIENSIPEEGRENG